MGFMNKFKKLFNLVMRADEKERKHISKDEKGRKNNKETNVHMKQTSVDNNQMKEKDKEKENMADIVMDKKSMIEYDNNKTHTYGDEDSNREIALPEDNSCSTKESENISSSKFGTKSSDWPTLSETVRNRFTVDADQVSENDDIRNETEDLPILPGFMPNKPTAIVKPCQKSDVQFMTTKHEIVQENDSTIKLNPKLKIYDPKKVYNTPKEDTNTGVKFEDESKDIHDDLNSLSKAEKIDNENKDITRTKNITENDVKEIEYKLESVIKETKSLIGDIKHVEDNNNQMMTIVEEFEKTINQLVMEKEREEICQQIVMERIVCERDDVVRDHQNVENAFVDLNHKYERTKQVVTGLQMREDTLKQSVEALTSRYTDGEQKYQDARTEAEDQLAKVGITLEARQRAKGLEIARLRAQFRKAEMNASSLEEEIDQKTQENKELTGMCDDLLAKLETAS